ncbi:MAG: superoxide dismutase, Fe-Mn family [Parcubacteria group bacterium Gr01-1014_44]|nr:MAG: superoxide dismutase, Fe-Mn family [Parcubacteria group bacterium Gr01-1014_44]
MPEPKPLPFEKELVGISKKTLEIHHDKLYVGYVKKSDEISEKLIALRKSGQYEGNATFSELRGLKEGETFAVNGVYLHEWYFDVLGGDGDWKKAPELSKALEKKWESVEEGIKWFSACAMAARGWSVLAWDTKAGKLKHYNSDSHNQGGVWGCLPIIVLDVYEHAYFIDYGSDRKKYIEDFWKNFNWSVAEELYLKAKAIIF